MDDTLILVGPGSITKEARYSCLHLFVGIRQRTSRLLHNAVRKFIFSDLQVFRDIIEDLSAIMRRSSSPTAGGMGGFYRVADIFAIAFPHLADDALLRIDDITAIA